MIRRAASGSGPPPLARGEQAAGDAGSEAGRTTPARAGRTGCCPRGARNCSDHPRSRGENSTACARASSAAGPPPLARGEPSREPAPQVPRRTTPARAGRTRPAGSPGSTGSDHPRSRGENNISSVSACRRDGPPPIARGERVPQIATDDAHRTTPARAGRTTGSPGTRPNSADHPRSRGENGYSAYSGDGGPGPPPLARGELGQRDRQPFRDRTTPARAGRTSSCWPSRSRSSDHPRSRGEN
ncbi:hypothetical protein SAMN06265355_12615 [Actinomadura mexicana]|uniref:Uncharacterized protein n=1 Tax=Actinomadura mexicana TaxID=134959 RepID=A0A239GTL5_9ACTN|nr:hypothetical protein SAMN06265355_12615 [Actinomadura mexicana]